VLAIATQHKVGYRFEQKQMASSESNLGVRSRAQLAPRAGVASANRDFTCSKSEPDRLASQILLKFIFLEAALKDVDARVAEKTQTEGAKTICCVGHPSVSDQ
jgi:hypothetical protein